MISIDAENGRLDLEVDEDELQSRRASLTTPRTIYQSGVLWKYAQSVGSARNGAVTHPGAKQEIVCYADQ
jgi:dihydroxy-acid dehydratase